VAICCQCKSEVRKTSIECQQISLEFDYFRTFRISFNIPKPGISDSIWMNTLIAWVSNWWVAVKLMFWLVMWYWSVLDVVVWCEGLLAAKFGSEIVRCLMPMLLWLWKAQDGQTQTTFPWWSPTRWLVHGIGRLAVDLAWRDSWPSSVHGTLCVTASRLTQSSPHMHVHYSTDWW